MAPDDIKPGVGDAENDPFDQDRYEYVEEVVEYKDTRALRTVLIIVLVILLLLMAGVGYVLWRSSQVTGGPGKNAANSGGMTWVRSIYGWGTDPDQQLAAPTMAAVGPDGTIWTNSSNKQAIAFTPAGQLVRRLASNPDTSTAATGTAMGHNAPTSKATTDSPNRVQAIGAIDVDSQNNLYIGDDAQGHLLKFTADGNLEKGWSIPGLGRISANDNAVAVTGKSNLGVFKQATGAPIYAFGTRGQGVNQFDMPGGVHIDSQGFVYVADTQNQRVRKYTPSGRLVWDAGTVPERKFQTHVQQPKGLFQLPTGVTTDANGRVIVVDAFNYNITVLDGTNGKKIAVYGQYGTDDGSFDNPSAIAYDPTHDYFVVADTGNNRLQVVRLPGSATTLAPALIVRQMLENPTWILCLPPLILLIAILIAAWIARRRRQRAEQEAAPAQQQ